MKRPVCRRQTGLFWRAMSRLPMRNFRGIVERGVVLPTIEKAPIVQKPGPLHNKLPQLLGGKRHDLLSVGPRQIERVCVLAIRDQVSFCGHFLLPERTAFVVTIRGNTAPVNYFNASMPGNVPCAKKSNMAPPAVETNVNLSFKPRCAIAATVSPPPIMVVALDSVSI